MAPFFGTTLGVVSVEIWELVLFLQTGAGHFWTSPPPPAYRTSRPVGLCDGIVCYARTRIEKFCAPSALRAREPLNGVMWCNVLTVCIMVNPCGRSAQSSGSGERPSTQCPCNGGKLWSPCLQTPHSPPLVLASILPYKCPPGHEVHCQPGWHCIPAPLGAAHGLHPAAPGLHYCPLVDVSLSVRLPLSCCSSGDGLQLFGITLPALKARLIHP